MGGVTLDITEDEIVEYIYTALIDKGLAPYKQDVEEIADIFINFLIDLGAAEEE